MQAVNDMKCKLCDYSNVDLKRFSDHVRIEHKLSSFDYTVQAQHGGIQPVCAECGADVRYVAFTFKKYCKEHARLAMKEGGARGGANEAWNRGKTKETDVRIAAAAERATGEGNHFYGKRHAQETIKRISENKTLFSSALNERISERSLEFKLITSLNEYHSRQQQYLTFECLKCGERQQKTLQAFERGSRCYRCCPVGKSNWELSVFEYVRSLSADAISGDRKTLSPKEIDIYVPSKKFGIECHGLFWHSEAGKPTEEFDKKSHSVKAEMAESVGISLLQIFEDEWRDKQDIIKSMIQHRLGFHPSKCKTWSTTVIELSTKEQKAFFNATHLAGYTPSKVCWGLRDRNGNIVAALSLRVPRHGGKYENSIEIARFSTQKGMSVPGGLSKLLKVARDWSSKNGYSQIMTYVDRRVGTGNGYVSAGFERVGCTAPDYWYTDNELRYDRFRYRAQLGLTERQVALAAKVSRIYGCGSHIFRISTCM